MVVDDLVFPHTADCIRKYRGYLPERFSDRLLTLARIAEREPAALWACCVRTWRIYCCYVSPTLITVRREIVPVLGTKRTQSSKINKFKGGRQLKFKTKSGKCLCGCGLPAKGFVKSAAMHHETHFRRRAANTLLFYGGDIARQQLYFARQTCPGIVSEDEVKLFQAFYQRDQFLHELPESAPLPVSTKNPFRACPLDASGDRDSLGVRSRLDRNEKQNRIDSPWRRNRLGRRKGE